MLSVGEVDDFVALGADGCSDLADPDIAGIGVQDRPPAAR